ncbi:hypothetical protein H4217_004857 [Coemansia sp. RSA 1939]|nr:hypothetical protein H4217_004857 [Coemansia sp. RSA 1939]
MAKLQLSSLDEFIESLSRQDYEAAKIASGKVMEDHIQMGALMFSLLTIEMMYTSMDYLTPRNFQRGNGYMLGMYNSLPRRLRKLHKRLVLEYEEEHQQLVASFVHPMQNGPAADMGTGVQQMGGFAHNSRTSHSSRGASRLAKRPNSSASAFQQVNAHPQTKNSSTSRVKNLGSNDNLWQSGTPGIIAGSAYPRPVPLQKPEAKPSESFGPKMYLGSLERAERVLEDLEALSLFVEFILKFIDVRKTMVVLYRFVAVTSPVLYVRKLDIMLNRCKKVIESIKPSTHYQTLLDNVRNEVWLVRNIVDWDSQIAAYNFVKAVTTMQNTNALLKSWQGLFSKCAGAWTSAEAIEATKAHSRAMADALGPNHNAGDDFGDSLTMQQHSAGIRGATRASHGLFYSALAKSSQLVQNFLWGSRSPGSSEETPEPGHVGTCGVIRLLDYWVKLLSFKTTAYFQQIIASYRSLYYDDMATQAKRAAVMNDVWSRPELLKTDLSEALNSFMASSDACFVTLLFESSKQHPYTPDGFAVQGTTISISDYRVQACAVLFCFTNERLMLSQGRSLRESIIHDVHSTNPSTARRTSGNMVLQSDLEWFRQNCLPDILYILDANRETLDYELLGSSPLVDRLGANSDELLMELGNLVHEVVEEAVESMNPVEESADGIHDILGHNLGTGDYPSDDAANTQTYEEPGARVYSEQDSGYEHHDIQPPEETHHDAQFIAVDRYQTAESRASEDNKDSANLYSTYLLKSHLRNNIQHEGHVYGGHAARRYASRPSGQAIQSKQRHTQIGGDMVGRDSLHISRDNGKHRTQIQTAKLSEPQKSTRSAQPKAKGAQKPDIGNQRVGRIVLDNSISLAAQSSNSAARRRVASTSGVSDIGNITGYEGNMQDNGFPAKSDVDDAVGRQRVVSVNNIEPHPHQLIRKSANTVSTPSPERRRTTQSIRSLFNPSLLLGMSSHQPQPQDQVSAEESMVQKRVRRGMRLRELFGSWDTSDVNVPDDIPTSFLGREARTDPINSLSFSTPVRASIGSRPSGGASAALGGVLGAETLHTHESGSGLAHRLSREPAPSAILFEPDTPRNADNAESITTLDQLRRSNHSLFQQGSRASSAKQPQPQPQPQQPPPLHSGHSSSDAVAGVTSETYTYMYARVGLPNVVIVAALLDTERGLSRRRDAQCEWDKIVDKVRGMALFEQMMTTAE